jgi:hypothetical protein
MPPIAAHHLRPEAGGCDVALLSMVADTPEESTMTTGNKKKLRKLSRTDELLLERVQRASFEWFLEYRDRKTGLTQDRTRPGAATIAGVGFALTCAAIGIERKWISRSEGIEYTLSVLRTLAGAPQGDATQGCAGYHGYFYHFLEPDTGLRATSPKFWNSELSSIDTALLMAGVVFVREYYRGRNAEETEIRQLATKLYESVEWNWMLREDKLICMGWNPETGWIPAAYKGYCEAPILYLLALGSPKNAVAMDSWKAFTATYTFEQAGEQHFITMPGNPLFCYQYPHCWIDFRGIRDEFTAAHGIDYFENSRRATLAHYWYATNNPGKFRAYGTRDWGLTACDGPGDVKKVVDNREVTFRGYSERGCPNGFDDGTIAPTAAVSSLPFAPRLVMPTLRGWLKDRPELFNRFGFADAFNPTFDASTPSGWIDSDRLAIDQGPIVIMIENYRSGFVWDVMRRSKYLRRGLKRAGFSGGWLK